MIKNDSQQPSGSGEEPSATVTQPNADASASTRLAVKSSDREQIVTSVTTSAGPSIAEATDSPEPVDSDSTSAVISNTAYPVSTDEKPLCDRGRPDTTDEGSTALSPTPPNSKLARALDLFQAKYRLVYTDDGKAFAVDDSGLNPQTFRIGTKAFNSAARRLAFLADRDLLLTADDLAECSSQMEALADLTGEKAPVSLRVAETEDGIKIDMGDESWTQIAVGPGSVKVIKQGSTTLFYRNSNLLPFAMPAETGDINKLLPYLNVKEEEKWLLIAWITYTLAHPKVPSSNYVILVLRGERGTGKSTLCNVIIGSLVGPTSIGVQAFPSSQKDLAIAVGNAHVCMYDNLRSLKPSQADMLCRTSTSAAVSTRKLYTDGDEFIHTLHGALVLNGVHSFIDQDDLAQRCLSLKAMPLEPEQRSTEKQLRKRFEADQPVIFRGVLDLIAEVLVHLPNVSAMYPERMLEFVHWLAAMEKALRMPEGQLQRAYSNNLVEAMQDTLQDSPLAEATIQFAMQHTQRAWGGQPADLLLELGKVAGKQTIVTREWPQNAIQLSLRLKKLKSKLSGAGVEITLGRENKKRHITVKYTGRSS